MEWFNGLEGLFEGLPFPADLERLMEEICRLYSFGEWKIPIVENFDIFIDKGGYHTHTISFFVSENALDVGMIEIGIPPKRFNKLPGIAFTIKLEEICWGIFTTAGR